MKNYTCTKPRSRKVTTIEQMDKDDWFYKLKTFQKSSGKIDEQGMIIKSQIPLWTEKFKREGYLVVVEDI